MTHLWGGKKKKNAKEARNDPQRGAPITLITHTAIIPFVLRAPFFFFLFVKPSIATIFDGESASHERVAVRKTSTHTISSCQGERGKEGEKKNAPSSPPSLHRKAPLRDIRKTAYLCESAWRERKRHTHIHRKRRKMEEVVEKKKLECARRENKNQ